MFTVTDKTNIEIFNNDYIPNIEDEIKNFIKNKKRKIK